MREPETLTFIKCGSYKDRPSQADNLHVDIWYKGINILPDAGSYKYNTDAETMRYFSGTRSHNTVMLDDNDQMLKGGHFIWFYWTECKKATLEEDARSFVFTGAVSAFKYVKQGIEHRRIVIKQKGVPVWTVKDEIIGAPAHMELRQWWHMQPGINAIVIKAKDVKGEAIAPQTGEGWYSSFYGQKEKTVEIGFSAVNKIIDTVIKVEE